MLVHRMLECYHGYTFPVCALVATARATPFLLPVWMCFEQASGFSSFVCIAGLAHAAHHRQRAPRAHLLWHAGKPKPALPVDSQFVLSIAADLVSRSLLPAMLCFEGGWQPLAQLTCASCSAHSLSCRRASSHPRLCCSATTPSSSLRTTRSSLSASSGVCPFFHFSLM